MLSHREYEKYNTVDFSDQLHAVLETFTPHGLDDLNKSELMDRVDTKFLIPKDVLLDILQDVNQYYSVLEINKRRQFQYSNIYFDTQNFELYHQHHNAKLNRYKVRCRCYEDSQLTFLEVKFKNNKARTLKTRVQKSKFNALFSANEAHFLSRHSALPALSNLRPAQHSGYTRVALANEAVGERVTIDTDLSYRLPDSHETPVLLDNICIVEVKQNSTNRQSPFMQILKSQGLRPVGFSKYCIGMALLKRDDIKANRFKATLNKVFSQQRDSYVPTH